MGILISSLGIITLIFLLWLGVKYFQKLSYVRFLNRLHPLDKLYREMLDLLGENGYRKKPAQTPYEYADSLRIKLIDGKWQTIDVITNAYVQWRYGSLDFDIVDLRSQFQSLRQSFRKK